jgi:outer membrane protein
MLKEFLKISKLKFETGAVGMQDVYRFETELAVAESDLISAETALKNSEVRLNKILNLKQDTKHSYEDLDSLKAKFSQVKIPMKEMTYNDSLRLKVTEHFIDGALNNSNNLKIAENKIEDIDSQYKAASRSRYLPDVEGFARYNKNNIGSSGKDSENDIENYWSAGVGVSLPLFTSGEIHYRKKSLESEKEAVSYEKSNVENSVERDMNVEMNRLIGSYNQILTTESAKNASKKYLDISINQYKIGSINITDLLEAKNTYVAAEMNNLIANYRLFNSQVAVEKTYGEYLFLKNDAEKRTINEELKSLLKN